MKPPRRPRRAGVVLERGQQLDERVDEARDRVARELLEHAEVDDLADDGLARPVVGAAQDPRLEDAQRRLRAARCRAIAARRLRRPSVRAAWAAVFLGRFRGAGSACASWTLLACWDRSVRGRGAGSASAVRRLTRRASARGRISSGEPPRAAPGAATRVPPAEVEPVAGRQAVQHDAADHQRPVAADLPGVGLGRGAVHDRDRAAADDLHDLVRAHDAGRVLVDAEAQQARVLGDEARAAARAGSAAGSAGPRSRPAAARGRRRSAPSGASAWRPRRRRRSCGCDTADAPADVPATTAPGLEARQDRVRQARPADHRRQPELVAAGHEDAGGVADRRARRARRWPACA